MTAVLVAPPQHGTFNLLPNGGFTYTPDADYFGNDGFAYKAAQPGEESAVTAVDITVDAVQDPGKFAFAANNFFTDERTGTGIVTIVRTGGSEGTVNVDYAVTGDTATPFDDFFPSSDTLKFLDGEISQDVLVGVVSDEEPELSEMVKITLSNAADGATFAGGIPPEATLTIINSDPPPAISFNDPAPVAEGDPGDATPANVPFVLTLAEASS